jgi:hypothetical protein
MNYVISWLKSGRHGALDKPTSGLPKKVNIPYLTVPGYLHDAN